jgi:hypothetical protein
MMTSTTTISRVQVRAAAGPFVGIDGTIDGRFVECSADRRRVA